MDFGSIPHATLIFLVANVIISLIGFSNPAFRDWGVLHVGSILRKNEWHRVLTAGFLHADPFHLFFNMYTFYYAGPVLEQFLGSQGLFIAYLGALVAGNLGALFRHSREPQYSALGASGAVSGVLLAVCMLSPWQVWLIFGILPLWAMAFAVLFVVISWYGMRQNLGNIGHDAHLFGAAAGVIISIVLRPDLVGLFISQLVAGPGPQ